MTSELLATASHFTAQISNLAQGKAQAEARCEMLLGDLLRIRQSLVDGIVPQAPYGAVKIPHGGVALIETLLTPSPVPGLNLPDMDDVRAGRAAYDAEREQRAASEAAIAPPEPRVPVASPTVDDLFDADPALD